MVAKIFIDGEAGTTGLQIRERLTARTDIELLSIAQEHRKDLSARQDLLNASDVAILCLPDDAAKQSVSLIDNQTTRVIDASTAFRTDPNWAYGFAEMAANQSDLIANARFVSNPGCWPQGLIASVRPLIEAGLMSPDYPVTMTGISGYSGGGKQMIAAYEAQGVSTPEQLPYGLTFGHKHASEMTLYAKLNKQPLFVPSVGDYYKGMLELVPLHLDLMAAGSTTQKIHTALRDYFANQSDGFVSVAPLEALGKIDDMHPEALNGTNQLKLYVFGNDEAGQVSICAVYDNLGKGASGAAVQNLNLMIGADPRAGL